MNIYPLSSDNDLTVAGDLRLWATQWPTIPQADKQRIKNEALGEQAFFAMLNGIKYGPIAQRSEQASHKRLVEGSNPSWSITQQQENSHALLRRQHQN